MLSMSCNTSLNGNAFVLPRKLLAVKLVKRKQTTRSSSPEFNQDWDLITPTRRGRCEKNYPWHGLKGSSQLANKISTRGMAQAESSLSKCKTKSKTHCARVAKLRMIRVKKRNLKGRSLVLLNFRKALVSFIIISL